MKFIPLPLALLLGLTACQGQNQNPEKELLLGQQALTQNDTDAAIRHLTAVIQQQPQQETAWLLRSEAHYRRKEYAAALTDARQVLDIDPQHFTAADYTALYNLGVIHNSRREFAEARTFLLRARAKDSTDVRLYENLGYGYLEQNNPAAALREFQAMARQDAQAKKAFYGIGKSQLLLKQYQAAVTAFDRAIQLDPAYGMAYQNRGAARFSLGDQASGCEDWQRAIELGLKELEPYRRQFCP
jgi:tetratricopeptide (TPR) repeat protein